MCNNEHRNDTQQGGDSKYTESTDTIDHTSDGKTTHYRCRTSHQVNPLNIALQQADIVDVIRSHERDYRELS